MEMVQSKHIVRSLKYRRLETPPRYNERYSVSNRQSFQHYHPHLQFVPLGEPINYIV